MSVVRNKNSSELWEAFLKGGNNAFADFYFHHIDQMLAYGRKITVDSDMLRDAVQEVFTDVYEKRHKPNKQIDNPSAYLMVALRNNIYKKKEVLRKAAGHTLNPGHIEEFHIEYSFQDTLICQEIQEESLRKLRTAINSLTSGQKEIIYLRYEQGLGYSEIADIMQINKESARKQMHRAILSLKKILDSKMFQILFIHFFRKK